MVRTFESGLRSNDIMPGIEDGVEAGKEIEMVTHLIHKHELDKIHEIFSNEKEFMNWSDDTEMIPERQLTTLIGNGGAVIGAYDQGGKLIGFTVLSTAKKESLRILAIGVNPEQRGQKIGEKLFDEMVNYAKSKNISKIARTYNIFNPISANIYIHKASAQGIKFDEDLYGTLGQEITTPRIHVTLKIEDYKTNMTGNNDNIDANQVIAYDDEKSLSKVVFPDIGEEILLKIPDFDFNEESEIKTKLVDLLQQLFQKNFIITDFISTKENTQRNNYYKMKKLSTEEMQEISGNIIEEPVLAKISFTKTKIKRILVGIFVGGAIALGVMAYKNNKKHKAYIEEIKTEIQNMNPDFSTDQLLNNTVFIAEILPKITLQYLQDNQLKIGDNLQENFLRSMSKEYIYHNDSNLLYDTNAYRTFLKGVLQQPEIVSNFKITNIDTSIETTNKRTKETLIAMDDNAMQRMVFDNIDLIDKTLWVYKKLQTQGEEAIWDFNQESKSIFENAMALRPKWGDGCYRQYQGKNYYILPYRSLGTDPYFMAIEMVHGDPNIHSLTGYSIEVGAAFAQSVINN